MKIYRVRMPINSDYENHYLKIASVIDEVLRIYKFSYGTAIDMKNERTITEMITSWDNGTEMYFCVDCVEIEKLDIKDA